MQNRGFQRLTNPEVSMDTGTNHPILSETQASGGKKLGSVRYVLGVSLALAVVAGVIIWNVFAR